MISNGCGASVGLEAGYTQIGAGAASWIGRLFNLRRNDLRLMVGCGAAGAIAAAFNAPLSKRTEILIEPPSPLQVHVGGFKATLSQKTFG